jgi:hypothetical protein
MAGPFRFMTSVQAVQLTGVRAASLAELYAGMQGVDGSSIYHHTHRFYRAHSFLGETPLSDFALWVGESLQEAAVAEEMAALDLRDFTSIRELRTALLAKIESVREVPERWSRRVPAGLEFHFCRSVSLILPTGIKARNLEEFVDALERVDTASLYHHLIEAPLHADGGRAYRNEFSEWLAGTLAQRDLAEAVVALDPYRRDLEGLRRDLIAIFRPRRVRRTITKVLSRHKPVSGVVSEWFKRWREGA